MSIDDNADQTIKVSGHQGVAQVVHLPLNTFLQNRYVLESILGIGGFGIVYKARDTLLQHAVAIKEYYPDSLAHRDQSSLRLIPHASKINDYTYCLEQFLEEARTLAKFKHPQIIRVTDFFETHNTAYLVMDYEQGETLDTYVALQREQISKDSTERRRGFIPEVELRFLLDKLLAALKVIHASGVLHRDIKPNNILIRPSGEPLLLDFGAARMAIGEKSGDISVILTNGYAPPEQYSQDRTQQGPWTDLYALGATLYFCLSGSTPIYAGARVNALSEQEPDPLMSAVELGNGLYSEGLLAAIDTLLCTSRKRRPRSVDDMETILKQLGDPGTLDKFNANPPQDLLKTKLKTMFSFDTLANTHNIATTKAPKQGLNLKVLGVVSALALIGLLATVLVSRQKDAAQATEQMHLAVAKANVQAENQKYAAVEAQKQAQQEAKVLADAKAQQEAKVLADAKAQQEAKVLADAKAQQEAKVLADAKAQQEAKVLADAKAQQEAKVLADAKAQQEAKAQADAKAQQEAKALAETKRLACARKPYCMMDAGDGVLSQPSRGLEWNQADNGVFVGWESARKFCASRGEGWRLPSSIELQSLYDSISSVFTKCGSFECNVSPLFRLSSYIFWTHENYEDGSEYHNVVFLAGPNVLNIGQFWNEGSGELFKALVFKTEDHNKVRALCVREN